MLALLSTILIVSLVGSLHCAGMCGGIVLMCVHTENPDQRVTWLPHVTYHGGRAITYALLGVIAGAVGTALDLGGGALGIGQTAAWVAGGLMIGLGVVAMLQRMGVRIRCAHMPKAITGFFRRAYSAAFALPVPLRAGLIGLLTGLLPCGWLYAFVLAAAGTGSPVIGGAVMLAFWAGTVPILLGLGIGSQTITAPLRRHAPTLTAVALVVVGIITISGRMSLATVHAPAPEISLVNSTGDVVDVVHGIDETLPPCCSEHD
ncbi:MAG: sulfite exporter TauE/SafE family protein [Planctomycetota bacterium]